MMNSPDIDIDVHTQYVAAQSDPEAEKYVFAYTIKITNNGERASQLLSRHWIITDGTGSVEEVRGEGVVGEQPRLQQGEVFKYTSGAILKTPVGSMRGSYLFQTDDGESFDVPIAIFSLNVPHLVH